jgi:twitching motility protein PilT
MKLRRRTSSAILIKVPRPGAWNKYFLGFRPSQSQKLGQPSSLFSHFGLFRDAFSLTTSLRAADTGHLVFTTVHATNAPMTIGRMVSLFVKEQAELQQEQLAMNLNAIVCQRLAKRRDGSGRIPVNEIMMATPLVRKYILDGEFDKLKGCVGNRESGSQSFDQHLTELFQKQIIDVNEAKRLATNVDALTLALRGISNSDTRLR